MSLDSFGWTSSHQSSFDRVARPGTEPGRILTIHGERVRVQLARGDTPAFLRGTLHGPDAPVVGDWVVVRAPDDATIPAVVEAVLPRHSCLSRKAAGRTSASQHIAANVDVVFIVMALGHDFNPARLERYLSAVGASGAEAVVVLTKADLVDDPSPFVAQLTAEVVVVTSMVSGLGLADLQTWVGPGRTVALVGSSGVGKSTLVNALTGQHVQRTGEVRADDHRGRHTTTHRVLVPLAGGGVLLDTPGMRELGLDGQADPTAAFPDILGWAAQCRWRNCEHDAPAGCAVLAAVDRGDLSQERLQRFQKVVREVAWEARRGSSRLQRENARAWQAEVRQVHRWRRASLGLDDH